MVEHLIFTLFTSEVSIKDFKKPVYELSYADRKRLYNSVKNLWQKMVEITTSNYINITDTSKCPVHFSEEKSYWYANHQDPAFAELKKELYRHEMPKIVQIVSLKSGKSILPMESFLISQIQ